MKKILFILTFTLLSSLSYEKLNSSNQDNDNPSMIRGKIGISYIIHQLNGYVMIDTNDEFMKNPFKAKAIVDDFQLKYNNIFSVNSIELDEGFNENFAQKLLFKDSHITIHHQIYEGIDCDKYLKIDSHNIVYGVVKNKEIALQYDIEIGMSKEKLLSEVFGFSDVHSIDTLWCGDEIGDHAQEFIFKSDTLEKVLISSNYNFVEFNLYDKD